MPAAAVLVNFLLENAGAPALIACTWALREGILLSMVSAPARKHGSLEARHRSVAALVRRFGALNGHGPQVARLALKIFDAASPILNAGPQARELLEHAALLHDIGQHVSADSHHKHSAYLIQHGRLDGFEREEVDALAALARYHRRSEPKSSHEPFASLSMERRRRVICLAGLLRVADGLDYGHTGAVGRLDVSIGGGALRIELGSGHDLELALWGARSKRHLLERVLAQRVEVSAPDGEDGGLGLSTAA
jgi:exopolyphosphatase/guanosine-5'-triphosphate,3'-diphosphate pyrophosphatase